MRSMNYDDQKALNATRTRVVGIDELDGYESKATPENSVRQGTPEWDAIVQGAEKKGKK